MEATPPPSPTPPAARALTVGGVIEEAFALYRAHAGTLIPAAAVVFVVAGVIQALLRDTDSAILAGLGSIVSLIASALFTGFVVTLVADVRNGKRDFTVGELFSNASHAILPLIGFGILAGLGIGIGFLLLIIPGLYLLTMWSVGSPAIVVERTGVFEAFGRSHELVKGNGWTVFGAIVTVFLILLVIGIAVGAIGFALQGVILAAVFAVIFNVLVAPVVSLVASVLFFELGGGAAPAATSPPPAPAPAA